MSAATPIVLVIAGSDSGAGAGIQADLKTCMALGAYATTALTAVTAQNTQGVSAVHMVPPEVITAQIDAIAADIGADAVKIGMLGDVPTIQAVAAALRRWLPRLGNPPVVLDPVMVAKGGSTLLDPAAVAALIDSVLPLATVLTPNLPEASALLAREVSTIDHLPDAARELGALGPAVLLKGGHLPGPELLDLLWDGRQLTRWSGIRRDTPHTHGTGCTYAAAVAAGLAAGMPLPAAVGRAHDYLAGAIAAAGPLGAGSGHSPVAHAYRLAAPAQVSQV